MEGNMDMGRELDTPVTGDVAEHSSSEAVSANAVEHSSEGAVTERRMNTGSYRKRKAKKQVGVEMTVEDLRAGWSQCNFFMAQKKRLCNIGRTPGSLYCGTHRPLDEDGGNRAMKKSKFKNIELSRIPCPIDPSHSIYTHNLLLHTKICNIRTRQLEMKEEDFYCFNCNSGNNRAIIGDISDNNDEIMTNNDNNDSTNNGNNGNDNNTNSNSNNNNNDTNHDENNENKGSNNTDDNTSTPICPDSLLSKIKSCYQKLVQQNEFSYLENTFEDLEGEKEGENRVTDIEKGENGENGDKGRVEVDNKETKEEIKDVTNEETMAEISMSPSSYQLLESRVVCAVSGDQVAFDRVRHAQQDAMIVRQMVLHGLIDWDVEKEKNKTSVRRNEKKDEKKLFYATNHEEVEEKKRKLSSGLVYDTMQSTYGEVSTYDQSETVFLELGAGKGLLGLAVSSVKPKSTLVLVERSGMRRKVDKALREMNCRFYRARMDIRHCYIPYLPGILDKEKEGKMKEKVQKKEIGEKGTKGEGNGMENDANDVKMTVTKNGEEEIKEEKGANKVVSEGEEKEEKIEEIEGIKVEKEVVIMAKHLCGVATDLALRSLESFKKRKSGQNDLDKRAKGVAIATCCHHACVWDDYTGSDWLLAQGFTPSDFEVMRLWSGWAHTLRTKESRRKKEIVGESGAEGGVEGEVEGEGGVKGGVKGGGTSGGDKDGGDNAIETEMETKEIEDEGDEKDGKEEHSVPKESSSIMRPTGITYTEMAETGKMVKRIFDQGRVAYIRNLGLNTKQIRYCDPLLSPECVMIIATKK